MGADAGVQKSYSASIVYSNRIKFVRGDSSDEMKFDRIRLKWPIFKQENRKIYKISKVLKGTEKI